MLINYTWELSRLEVWSGIFTEKEKIDQWNDYLVYKCFKQITHVIQALHTEIWYQRGVITFPGSFYKIASCK